MTEPLIHMLMRVRAELAAREDVGVVLRAVCQVVERAHGCSGLEWRVVSAFNEAFNNVVEHAYAPEHPGEACIEVTVDSARLVLELRDNGRGFDFEARVRESLPEVDSLDEGGMGLFIIRNAMSSVSYERGAPNRLRMTQDLSAIRGASDPNEEASRC
jgi:anti-sigma regulatory factor (Ser/Thr protein kinase)